MSKITDDRSAESARVVDMLKSNGAFDNGRAGSGDSPPMNVAGDTALRKAGGTHTSEETARESGATKAGEETARESGATKAGAHASFPCPLCGASSPATHGSYQSGAVKVRYRECVRCEWRFRTRQAAGKTEMVVG